MDILFILIPIAIVVMIIAIIALLWAIKNGQFDDMDGPAHRILMDDDDPLDPWHQQNKLNKQKITNTDTNSNSNPN